MRNSVIALILLIAIGVGGYYAMYGLPSIKTERAMAVGDGSEAPKKSEGEGGAGKAKGDGAAKRERGGDGGGERRGGRMSPVEVGLAKPGVATDDLWSVGSLRSDESLQVSSEIAGRIAEIIFKEGEEVKAGDVLVKLDEALSRADVEDAKAKLVLAQSNFDRAQSLSRSGSGTERALDETRSALESAKAAVQLSETRLSKLTITAPFPGRVGLRGLSVGTYITPGLAVVNLEKIDTLKLDFRVPETVLTRIQNGQDVEMRVDAYPERKFTGKVYAIDPQVDVNGRALRVRARIDNTDRALLPGLFARVIIKGLEERQVVRVPEGAVVPKGQDRYVFTIVGGKAKENKVQVGRRRNGEVEIVEGLEAGMQIITSGQANLRDGSAVEVVPGPVQQSAKQD
jgi:membrane fusion protein (multidrug efflux system)